MDDLIKKILIIDDEPRIRSIYVRLLVESGLKACWASNAQEATNILIREKIDLVLLDINMPGIDGMTMFDIIQEYDPSLKVIVASVYQLFLQKRMIDRAYDYYDKSQGASLLLEKIFNALKGQAH
ncbi:MAG: response regulator [Candidatus Omnitrophica bacterium]|nr:response regulator [Candidatus Omnitrophota bacterium]